MSNINQRDMSQRDINQQGISQQGISQQGISQRDFPQNVDQSMQGQQVHKSVGEWATGEPSKLKNTDWSGGTKPGFEKDLPQRSYKDSDPSISSGESRMDTDYGGPSHSHSQGVSHPLQGESRLGSSSIGSGVGTGVGSGIGSSNLNTSYQSGSGSYGSSSIGSSTISSYGSSSSSSHIGSGSYSSTDTSQHKGGILGTGIGAGLFHHGHHTSSSLGTTLSSSSSHLGHHSDSSSHPVQASTLGTGVGSGMSSGLAGIASNLMGTDMAHGVAYNQGTLDQPTLKDQHGNWLGPSSELHHQQHVQSSSGSSSGSHLGGVAPVPTSRSSMQDVASRISGNVSSFHSLSARDASGQLFNFGQLVGRPVLIVNVALESRLTSQFSGLQALYDKYRHRGFEILAFPCDQFGGGASGTSLELRDHITRTFGVTFPIMEKVEVSGNNEHPVFDYLKSHKKNMLMEAVKWNFEKFLVDGQGNVVQRWSSVSSPESIDPHIARLLQEGNI
jgi:glutathione peroxidase